MRFLSYFTDISAEWFTRGNGEIFLKNTESSIKFDEKNSDSVVITLLKRNEELARENGRLQAENNELKKELAQAETKMAASAKTAAG